MSARSPGLPRTNSAISTLVTDVAPIRAVRRFAGRAGSRAGSHHGGLGQAQVAACDEDEAPDNCPAYARDRSWLEGWRREDEGTAP